MSRGRSLVLAILFLALPVQADDVPAPSLSVTQQAQKGIDRALEYIKTESDSWQKTRKCAACHHVPMPIWAMNEAAKNGFTIDKTFVNSTMASVMESRENLIATKVLSGPKDPPDTRLDGKGLNIGTAFLTIAAESMPSLTQGQKACLKELSNEIVKKQQPNGVWLNVDDRPPIHECMAIDAVWGIIALQAKGEPSKERSEALKKAEDWLAATKLPTSHQGKVLGLLLRIRAGQTRKDLQPAIDELLALQQNDGGWRQTNEMASDAYATGQTLYVLSLVGYTMESAEIKKAVQFLVSTQKADGSWPMVSRPKPGGAAAKLLTPITCAASSWAVLGMSKLVAKM